MYSVNRGLKITIAIAIVVLAAGAAAFLFFSGKKSEAAIPSNDAIFIYGQAACSHCINLEKYIKEKNIDSKVEITRRPVDTSRENVNEMFARAKSCGINTDTIGTPFMWHKGKCLMGDVEIIEYLKQWEK